MQVYQKTGYKRFFRWVCRGAEQEKCHDLLSSEGFDFAPVPEVPGAWVEENGPFGLGASLAGYFGFLYIQDLSSMLPPILLAPGPGQAVLDMCAAPGGKSVQLAEMTGEGGLVIANEPSRDRLGTLRANLERLNAANVVTTNYAGQAFPQGPVFDCILVDAPCSGWGTVGKNPAVTRVWKKENLHTLIEVQRKLLEKAYKMLAPGGRLVYSTCTTNEEENQNQVHWILKRTSLAGSPRAQHMQSELGLPGLESTAPGMLVMKGDESGSQSFFMAALEKPGKRAWTQENDKVNAPSSWHKLMPEGFDLPEPLEKIGLYGFSGKVFFVPDKALPYVHQGLRIKGMFAGSLKKNSFVPNPRMRIFLKGSSTMGYQVRDVQEVRALVSGQSRFFDASTRNGLVEFYWQGLPMGWLKHKKSRVFWSDK
ncbi:tRNA (cytosine-5-)-methyltransferase [Desulfonatronospira thiodismutans ASO3-1]|uniref:tRNA (Cytosine-5-)-methyltransferase n=1 Tax=Desulfonatronospira thiodismutans ASO3-1 TaxID=555779 RepID=D6STF6_9BACT|nr:RsmB/NOP family class I SAM-dependent RNA methyltransferase [Desulfonatronospira thiodismutans]EFI33972.1 tRNA (cytosine-5-)-methyltransferase [Desulfonatronospira thiodismutans ASO3-1]